MFAQISNPWWMFILLGVFAGIISGLLGIGSGTVIVPALVIIAGATQKSAQGTALAVMVPMALLSAIRYWRSPDIDLSLPIIALIVIGSLAGVLIGTELAIRLPAHILKKIFATFLAVVAVRMFLAPTQPKQNDMQDISEPAASVENPGGNTNE